MKPWKYEGRKIRMINDVPKGMTHFVYEIINPATGKKYIGQKGLYSKARWKVNKKSGAGQKTRTSLRESNWLTYYGSSGQLTEDVKQHGNKDDLKREILCWCDGKACANYMETLIQITNDVVRDHNYYNGIISCRISHNQIKNSKQLNKLLGSA